MGDDLQPGELYDVTIARGKEDALRYPQLRYEGTGHAWWGEPGYAEAVWHVFRSPNPMAGEHPTWLLVRPEDLREVRPSSAGRSKLPSEEG